MQDSTSDHEAGRKRSASEFDPNNVNDTAAVRRRISRACDQCNQLRSKCDGKQPCAHCAENQLLCAYERAHKKRGRVPKKELGQVEDTVKPVSNLEAIASDTAGITQISGQYPLFTTDVTDQTVPPPNSSSKNALHSAQDSNAFFNGYGTTQHAAVELSSTMPSLSNEFGQAPQMAYTMDDSSVYNSGRVDLSGYGFPLGDDFSVAFMGKAPMIESPDWLALTSPSFVADQWTTTSCSSDAIRYPVLQPVLPHLESIIPPALACDLLEQYFASATPPTFQLRNPYVLSYVFRKQSILHPSDPRPCTTSLLVSMLWISAQHSDAPLLTAQPGARAYICQKLLELTISMLKPLVHNHGSVSQNSTNKASVAQVDASLGGLVLPIDVIAGGEINRKQVDNIVTYCHLATVVSASERKAASLRWWNAAWSLAREIRLGRELPTEQNQAPHGADLKTGHRSTQHRAESLASGSKRTENGSSSRCVSEEEREERRRTWWLLYIMDRHLALCYNRPMFFLNKECEGLLQPMDETKFQLGQFSPDSGCVPRKGLDIRCSSSSVYGFFLPLMVILGEILDLNHARNRPRFGPGAQRPRNFSDAIDEIEEQLEAFGRSLQEVGLPSITANLGIRSNQHDDEFELQRKMVVAYGTHIMYVLHILLTGKWDPIALLDDNDLWISSQSFVNATGHAVSAAQALAEIIECDPDLSLMPYFFGIYLLQGSFLLLLFADKLQGNITPEVVRACETIVRAHEACVSTLDNQYQRNFRRVMRSALQQLRGRMQEDATEQQNWRREILKLYRWTGDGTGLAL